MTIKDVFMNEKRRVSLNCQKAFDTIRFDLRCRSIIRYATISFYLYHSLKLQFELWVMCKYMLFRDLSRIRFVHSWVSNRINLWKKDWNLPTSLPVVVLWACDSFLYKWQHVFEQSFITSHLCDAKSALPRE